MSSATSSTRPFATFDTRATNGPCSRRWPRREADAGAATGFVQRGVAGSPERASVIEMGGSTVGSGDSRITETAVRGLWQAWRQYMQV